MTLALSLLTLLGFSWFMTKGMDQVNTTHRLLIAQLLLIAALLAWSHEWLLLVLWTYLCANTLWRGHPLNHLWRLQTIGLLMLGWIILTPFITLDVVPFVLMGLVGLGLILVGLWAFTAYHIQPNHMDMGLTIAYGSAAMLGPSHSWYWLLVLPLLMLPWYRRWNGHSQIFAWIALMNFTALAFLWPIASACLTILALISGASFLWPHRVHRTGPDHGRLHYWCLLLQIWWHLGWRVRLIGAGWESAKLWGDRISQAENKQAQGSMEFFTHPHNEYLHVLFEHGVVGLGLLLTFIGWLAWHTFYVEPLLLIPGVGLCAIACTTFPWTLPYQIAQQAKGEPLRLTPFGCMGMVTVTWLVVLLLRAS